MGWEGSKVQIVGEMTPNLFFRKPKNISKNHKKYKKHSPEQDRIFRGFRIFFRFFLGFSDPGTSTLCLTRSRVPVKMAGILGFLVFTGFPPFLAEIRAEIF